MSRSKALRLAALLSALRSGERASREVRLGVAALALLSQSSEAIAQSLTVGEAMAAAARAPAVRLAELRRDGVAGEVLRQRGALDWRLDADASHQRYDCLGGAGLGDDRTAVNFGASRRFGNGVVVEALASGQRSVCSTAVGADAASGVAGHLGGAVSVPLLRGTATAAPIDAAVLALTASERDARFASAEAMLSAAIAYWDYRAAVERLAVLSEAESIGRRLLDDTRAIVDAHEAPASNLVPLRASLADRSRARVAATQALIDARFALAVAMGIDVTAGQALAPPSSAFAEPPTPMPSGASLHALASARRADLAALHAEVAAASRLVEFSENAARPQVDVGGRLQYGATSAATSAGGLDGAGLYAGLTLTVSAPVENRERMGSLAVRRAELAQSRTRRDDLARRIHLAVEAHRADVERLGAGLALAEEARVAYIEARDDETQRATAGLSTVLDVIILQDRAVSANLESISLRAQRAQALALLAFDVGALTPAEQVRFEALPTATTGEAAPGGARP